MFYEYNDSGYLSKMMYARKKDIPVEIAKVIVDAEGNMESIIGIGEFGEPRRKKGSTQE